MRKGFVADKWVVGLIVTALVAIILGVLLVKFSTSAKSQFTEEQCHTSLLMTRGVDKAYLGAACYFKSENPIPLKCTRTFLSVDEKVTLAQGAKESDVTTKYNSACNEATSCLAENVVAKQMASCWKRFFEGQTPVFQQLDQNTFDAMGEGKRACFVCAEITLENGAPHFDAYIHNQAYDSTQSFYQYFTSKKAYCSKSYQGNCYEGVANASGRPPIEHKGLPAGTYAIVFMREGMGKCSPDKPIDQTSLTHTVQAVPAADVPAACDTVIV